MAESDEEVDVEDISDSEQISNLRDLAEEDQKDNWYVHVSGFRFQFLGSPRHIHKCDKRLTEINREPIDHTLIFYNFVYM